MSKKVLYGIDAIKKLEEIQGYTYKYSFSPPCFEWERT